MTRIMDKGGWCVLGFLIAFGLSLLWNSNRAIPERIPPPPSIVDKYTIITDRGKCVVTLNKPLPHKSLIIFEGDFLGECEMYIMNKDGGTTR